MDNFGTFSYQFVLNACQFFDYQISRILTLLAYSSFFKEKVWRKKIFSNFSHFKPFIWSIRLMRGSTYMRVLYENSCFMLSFDNVIFYHCNMILNEKKNLRGVTSSVQGWRSWATGVGKSERLQKENLTKSISFIMSRCHGSL